MTQLQDRFSSLWRRCAAPKEALNTQNVWRDIRDFYGEKHRVYHTLQHIEYCLAALDRAADEVEHVDAVELSIWFHDIIFRPGQADNELKSAEYFSQVAKDVLSPSLVSHVRELIMATMHHHHKIKPPISLDSQFMVDIDLSSFGLDEKDFAQNTRDLRQEQPEQSDEEFRRSTEAFFRSLLQRDRIFYTPYFFNQLENKARQNIFSALNKLTQ